MKKKSSSNKSRRRHQRAGLAGAVMALVLFVSAPFRPAATMISLANVSTTSFIPVMSTVVASFLAIAPTVLAERPNIETHEDVIASREKRKRQLEKILENAKRKLEDDRTGVKQLSDQAKAQFEKKIPVYEHQLAELSRELDQEEVERILENARKHQERFRGDEL